MATQEEREISFEDLEVFASEILTMLKNESKETVAVLALSGDLGAGKTTFVKALGSLLGIHESITSPTFTIMKGYETTDTTFKQLIHMDAYRLEDETELQPLRFTEVLSTPNTLVCIEWADRIRDAVPPTALHITFVIKDEMTRIATISRFGVNGEVF